MKYILTAAAALTLITAPVFAQEGEKPKKPKANPEAMFKKLDTNGDGFLSVEEFTAGKPADKIEKLKQAFALKDADKDGKLSLEEMTAGKGAKGGKGKGKGAQNDHAEAQ